MTDLMAQTMRPGDDGYAEAATTYTMTGSPALVVRPRSAAEVAQAIGHAVGEGLTLSVKSGGHNVVGFGTNDGGLVIDMSGFADVEVLDAAAGRVRVGSGATWGQVSQVLAGHGLALTSGDTRSVGVGGLTLGGGMGWMVRQHGLTIDRLISADLVTADGRALHVSADEHPDLYWAIRGGGGNFGVVTQFEFSAHPGTTVHAGSISYAVDEVPALLLEWTRAMREAPEELNATLILMPAFGPDMPAMANALVCYAAADADDAASAMAPLLSLGTVLSSDIAEKQYADVLEEAHPPPGVRAIASNTLVESTTDEVAAALGRFYDGGSTGRLAFVRAVGGAMSRVPIDATAFAHRDVDALIVGAAFLPEPATDAQLAEALAPFEEIRALGVGAYAGFLGSATAADLAAIYPPDTMRRLVAVKRAYDPRNVFSRNFNIRP